MDQAKELLFGETLTLAVLLGWMTGTIRKFRPEAHAFREGEVVNGVFKEEFGTVLLPLVVTRDTETKLLRHLTDEEVGEAGFTGRGDAYVGLREFYPDLELDDVMAIVRIRPADEEAGVKFLDFMRRVGNSLAFSGYTGEALGLLTPEHTHKRKPRASSKKGKKKK